MSVLSRPMVATDALVLRAWPTGETSVVASLLTAGHGFLRVIAKGARAGASALRPLVQPGRLVAVECGLDPARELQYLRGGSALLDPLAIGNSLERTAYLLAGMELIDRCRPAAGPDEALFGLCRRFVQMLSCAPAEAAARLYFGLELGLLSVHGFAPTLEACAVCGVGVPLAEDPGVVFSAGAGGVVCPACAAGAPGDGRWSVCAGTVALLKALEADPQPRTADGGASRNDREAGILLHRFLGYHLPGYRLPAGLDLLRAGRRPAAAGAAAQKGDAWSTRR